MGLGTDAHVGKVDGDDLADGDVDSSTDNDGLDDAIGQAAFVNGPERPGRPSDISSD